MLIHVSAFVAFHHGRKNGPSLHKEFVIVAALVGSFSDALKVVQIQLTLETGKATHAKVLAHDAFGKDARLMDGKAPSVRHAKTGNVRVARGLQVGQHLVQLLWKGPRATLARGRRRRSSSDCGW